MNDYLDKLHETQLEILDEFVRICEKHNLTYSLWGGSCIGAIRHKGFIPWDDDLDVNIYSRIMTEHCLFFRMRRFSMV